LTQISAANRFAALPIELGVFAEFERSIIQERIRAGMKRARSEGKHLGRPRIDPAPEKRIQNQLRTGKGILKVAAECGVGNGTVERIEREMVVRPFDAAA
jgi:DNA invertase Pin-like site-specific DNA recombinase